MTTSLLTLKKEIMFRVRFIYLFKKALRPLILKSAALAAVVYAAAQFVFVAKVLENAPTVSQFQEFITFFVRAFTNTEISVQLLLLGAVIAGVLALRDFVRTISTWREFSWRRA